MVHADCTHVGKNLLVASKLRDMAVEIQDTRDLKNPVSANDRRVLRQGLVALSMDHIEEMLSTGNHFNVCHNILLKLNKKKAALWSVLGGTGPGSVPLHVWTRELTRHQCLQQTKQKC